MSQVTGHVQNPHRAKYMWLARAYAVWVVIFLYYALVCFPLRLEAATQYLAASMGVAIMAVLACYQTKWVAQLGLLGSAIFLALFVGEVLDVLRHRIVLMGRFELVLGTIGLAITAANCVYRTAGKEPEATPTNRRRNRR
jgi:hypothetical protein